MVLEMSTTLCFMALFEACGMLLQGHEKHVLHSPYGVEDLRAIEKE